MTTTLKVGLVAVIASAFAFCGSLPKMPEMNPKKIAWDQTVKPQIVSKCKSAGVKKTEQTDKVNDGVYLYVVDGNSEEGLAKVKEGLSEGGNDATAKFKGQLDGLKAIISKVPGIGDTAGAKLDELSAALDTKEEKK